MRSRSRMSAMRPSMTASPPPRGERLGHRIERRLRVLDDQQPRGAEGHHAMANLRTDRAAATGDDDGLALHQRFQPRIVDRLARPQQQILDRDIGEPRRVAALERRQPADDQMQPARAHQDGLGMGVRLESRRHHHNACDRLAAPGEIAGHFLDIVAVAEHRNVADQLSPVGTRRGKDADGPDTLHRAALDAAQQHLGIGRASDQQPR